MKKTTVLFAALVMCLIALQAVTYSQEKPPTLEVYFSPHGGCTDTIIKELDKAKNSIQVQAYSFTSAPMNVVILIAIFSLL